VGAGAGRSAQHGIGLGFPSHPVAARGVWQQACRSFAATGCAPKGGTTPAARTTRASMKVKTGRTAHLLKGNDSFQQSAFSKTSYIFNVCVLHQFLSAER
jgi:hypothetical protein